MVKYKIVMVNTQNSKKIGYFISYHFDFSVNFKRTCENQHKIILWEICEPEMAC